ncbi:MAG: hypothetical protein KJ737_08770 [Proteobacteria bacterium]|nr:hypothetical protein [Pseudomonadota bacterium]
MENENCTYQRISKFGFGVLFLIIAVLFLISGITVLPVLGLIVGGTFLGVSIYFFKAHLDSRCEIVP